MSANYAEEVLSTIGTTVKIGNTVIEGAYNYSDLGADAQELDCTGLTHTHAVKVPGLIDEPAWELDYYENETDWATIEATKNESSVTLTIEHSDGSKFTNTGKYASNYEAGGSVNGMHQCKAKFTLTSGTGWTRVPAPSV